MKAFALYGDHIWVDERGALRLEADSFSVCGGDGLCAGVFGALPGRYADLPVQSHLDEPPEE